LFNPECLKKALIITYYWPPSGGSGVQRWLKFVKYLRAFGWESVVFVPENPEYPEYDASLQKDVPEGQDIIRCPIWEPFDIYKKLTGRKKEDRMGAGFLSEKKAAGRMDKFLLWIRANFFIPDARKFWIKPSVRFLTGYLREHPVDVVVTTGPPMSVHLIGLKLKKTVHLPWLADFRDPWTSVDFYHELPLMRWADQKHHRLEKQVLETADQVTVISPGMEIDFRRLVNRPYTVITNGYDEDDFKTEEVTPDAKFSIAHFGSLGKGRDPVALWKTLSELKTKNQPFGNDLEIKLVGQVDFHVMDSIREYGLEENLNRMGYLNHDAMVKEMKRSQLLLLVINDTPNAKLIATGKVFEYLAAKRPILCIGPEDGDAAGIIKDAQSGHICNSHDIPSLEKIVNQLYREFLSGGLSVDDSRILQYTRRYLTGLMVKRLNNEH